MKKLLFLSAILVTSSLGQTFISDTTSDDSNNINLVTLQNDKYRVSHYKYISKDTLQGRAEYFNGNTWGTICGDFDFNITAADVFCRSISSAFGVISWTTIGNLPYVRRFEFIDVQNLPVVMKNVKCSGNEEEFDECQYKYKKIDCRHPQDVVVTCQTGQNVSSNQNYRLANPKTISSIDDKFVGVWGRVEIFNKNSWTQICDDGFTINNSKVICKSLNLPLNDVRFSNAKQVSQIYGQNHIINGPWYHSMQVKCKGTETSLADCPKISSNYCSHKEDVYVQCSY